nr:hypothetical protein [Nostoc sp. ZfuVER08]
MPNAFPKTRVVFLHRLTKEASRLVFNSGRNSILSSSVIDAGTYYLGDVR